MGSLKKKSFFCSAASDLFFKAYIISVNLVRDNLQEMCYSSWFEHYFKILNGWHSFWIIISEISAEYKSQSTEYPHLMQSLKEINIISMFEGLRTKCL